VVVSLHIRKRTVLPALRYAKDTSFECGSRLLNWKFCGWRGFGSHLLYKIRMKNTRDMGSAAAYSMFLNWLLGGIAISHMEIINLRHVRVRGGYESYAAYFWRLLILNSTIQTSPGQCARIEASRIIISIFNGRFGGRIN